MASTLELTPLQILDYINNPDGIRPGHPYWNDKTLPADQLVYSFKNRNYQVDYQLDPDVLADDASAITTDNLFDAGILLCTPTAARTKSIPTLAAFSSAILAKTGTAAQVDDSFEFSVINLAAATHIITLSVPAGVTAEGALTIDPVRSGLFRYRITDISAGGSITGDLYRIAG